MKRQPLHLFWHRIIGMIGLAMLLQLPVSAQSVRRLIAQSQVALEQWKLETAESTALAAVARSRHRPSWALHADALMQLGAVYSASGYFSKADSLLRQSLLLDSLRDDTSNLRYGNRHFTYAHHLLQYGYLGAGHKHLLSALRLDSLYGTSDQALGPILFLDLAYLHEYFLDNSMASHYRRIAEERCVFAKEPQGAAAYSIQQQSAAALHKAGASQDALEKLLAYIQSDSVGQMSSHPNHALSLSLIGTFYLGTGDLQMAESYTLQSLELAKQFYPAPSIKVAEIKAKYAAILFAQGRLQEAESLLLEAQTTVESVAGKFCSQNSLIEFLLGNNAAGQGDYISAIPHYEASIAALEAQHLPPTYHLAYANELLFNCYQSLGMVEQAAAKAEEIVHMAESLPSKSHQFDRNNLAVAYQCLNRYADAEAVLRQQLLIDSINGNTGPNHLLTLYNLVSNLQFQSKYQAAQAFLPALLNGTQRLLMSYRTLLGEQENRSIWNDHAITLMLGNSVIFQGGDSLAALADLGFSATVFQKSYLLRSLRALREAIRMTPDPALQQDWMAYLQKNAAFVQGQALSGGDRDSLLTPNPVQEERTLLRKLKPFADFRNALFVSADSIRAKIGPQEAVIEFVLYNKAPIEAQQPDFYYGAYVILKNSPEVQMVEVCRHADLQQLLQTTVSSPLSLYASPSRGVKPVSPARNTPLQPLYALVWAPLTHLLDSVERIYYAPDGLLHQIAFDALPLPDRTRLNKRYELFRLTNTGALVQGRQQFSASMVQSVDLYADMVVVPEARDSVASQLFSPLPHTRNEAEKIAVLLKGQGKNARLHLGEAGTESKFYTNTSASNPDILHFATHGISSVNDSLNLKTELIDHLRVVGADGDPLSVCGLLLHAEPQAATLAQEPGWQCDGFLNGGEISRLDFKATRLVILSACQTGVGEIQGAEGIYGLQRAFFIAGVDYVIASLWKVPDLETAEFMTCFYRIFLEGAELHAAFRQTQKEMDKRYPEHPEKWAAFILME